VKRNNQNLDGNAAYNFFTTDFFLHGVLHLDICAKNVTLGSTAVLYSSSLQKTCFPRWKFERM